MRLRSGLGANGTSTLSALPTIAAGSNIRSQRRRLIVQFGTNPAPLAATRAAIIKGRGGTDFGNAPWNGIGGIASLAASNAGGGDAISYAIGYVANSDPPDLRLANVTPVSAADGQLQLTADSLHARRRRKSGRRC